VFLFDKASDHRLKIKLFFRYINQNACARLTSRVWSKAGHFNKALSKGPNTTTWIWNLHSDAHDFDMQQSSIAVITRKVFSSNLAHLSLVFFWISGMHFHGAYFSNYDIWLKDPKHYLPSAHNVWSLIGQFQGIHITSGKIQLWRSFEICISLGPLAARLVLAFTRNSSVYPFIIYLSYLG